MEEEEYKLKVARGKTMNSTFSPLILGFEREGTVDWGQSAIIQRCNLLSVPAFLHILYRH